MKFYLWAQKADIPPRDYHGHHGWVLEGSSEPVGEWQQSWSTLYVNRSGVLRIASSSGYQKVDRDPDHVRRLMIEQWGAELD